ncbi:MAG: hypothetical protein ACOC2D_15420 [Spirochaetota bacterium]
MRRILLAVVASALLVGCTTVDTVPVLETGDPELESGSLVFTGSDGNLYVAEAGRADLVRLTDGADLESGSLRYSAYAWAGESVVYATQEADETGSVGTTLYTVRPGERARELFRDEGFAPFFLSPSPGGSRVGYLGGRRGASGFAMGSVQLETGNRTDHGIGQPFYATWSPDDTTLVTHIGSPGSRVGSRLALQTLGSDGESVRSAIDLGLDTGLFQTPDYAPDGSRIAVVLGDGEESGIHILDETGNDLGRLVTLDGSAASVAWSPTGNRLAYLDGLYTRSGALAGRLYVVGFGSRQPQVVSDLAIAHIWSPDATRLLYFEPFSAQGPGSNALAYRVVVYSIITGESTVVASIRPAPAFLAQIVPFIDQYERGYTLWSPDSRLVALNTLGADGVQYVHLLDTETYEADAAFRVSYQLAQDVPPELLGIAPADGIRTRAIAEGTIPFFGR